MLCLHLLSSLQSFDRSSEFLLETLESPHKVNVPYKEWNTFLSHEVLSEFFDAHCEEEGRIRREID